MEVETRIHKRFCDATAKHAIHFAPDFRPTYCASVLSLSPSSASMNTSNKNQNNNNNMPAEATATKRMSFSATAWPTLPPGTDPRSARIDVGACLVAACNVSDTIAPVPWPSNSSKKYNFVVPLQVGLQKVGAPSFSSSISTRNDEQQQQNQIQPLTFPRCSIRKTAARSFSFIPFMNELVAACGVNNVDSLKNLGSVNALVLARYAEEIGGLEWLQNVSSSSTPSGSATIALVLVIGVRLLDYTRLWISPHLRATVADAEAMALRVKQQQELQSRAEKLKTHMQVVMLPQQNQQFSNQNENSNNENSCFIDDNNYNNKNSNNSNFNLIDFVDENDSYDDDPWALRAGVWVVHTKNASFVVNEERELLNSIFSGNQKNSSSESDSSSAITNNFLLGNTNTSSASASTTASAAATKSGGTTLNTSRLKRLKASGIKISSVNEDAVVSNTSTAVNQQQQENASSSSANAQREQGGGEDGEMLLTEDKEDEIVQEEVAKVSLRCPFTFQIMKVPVKGSNCEHDSCFELSNYVLACLRDHSWNCPHCDRPAYFTQLRVDTFIEDAIKILTTEWEQMKLEKEQQQSKKNEDSSVVVEEEEEDTKTKKKRTNNNDSDDYDSDDDDEDDMVDRIFVYPESNGKPKRWEKQK